MGHLSGPGRRATYCGFSITRIRASGAGWATCSSPGSAMSIDAQGAEGCRCLASMQRMTSSLSDGWLGVVLDAGRTCQARSGSARRATRCSAMSIPALTPAEVMRSPSSTQRSAGRTLHGGVKPAQLVHRSPVGRRRPLAEQPGSSVDQSASADTGHQRDTAVARWARTHARCLGSRRSPRVPSPRRRLPCGVEDPGVEVGVRAPRVLRVRMLSRTAISGPKPGRASCAGRDPDELVAAVATAERRRLTVVELHDPSQ
jgi:hypothetical protein